MATVRLKKEFKALTERPTSPYFFVHGLHNDNLFCWVVIVVGPEGTPFENGLWKATLTFPKDYPLNPPAMKFVSPIFHPNVYRDGNVCISTLQTAHRSNSNEAATENWRPILGVEQAILSVVSIFTDPNCDSPANSDASALWRTDRDSFKEKVAQSIMRARSSIPADFIRPSKKELEANQAPPPQDDDDEDADFDDDMLFGDPADDYDDDDDDEDQNSTANDAQVDADAALAAALQAELDGEVGRKRARS